MPIKIKFETLKNIEYLDVSKNGVNVMQLGTESEGMKWRDFQKLIGEKCGEGIFSYSFKQKNKGVLNIGRVKSLIANLKPIPKSSDKDLVSLNIKLTDLSKKVDSFGGGNGVTFDTLLEITKSSYVTRIEFLNIEATRRESDYTILLTKVATLESSISEKDFEIKELEGSTGIMQLLEVGKEFLKMKAGNVKPIESLAHSDATDIPAGITEVLGAIDWGNVPEDVINEIIKYLQIFATKLPLKGA